MTDLPQDITAYHDPAVDDYNWRLDAYRSYLLAIRMKALAIGSIGPATPAEMYWAEAYGQIP